MQLSRKLGILADRIIPRDVLFLCMFVGGIYVFRYLGTDVLEQRTKDIEAEKRALKAA